MAATLQDASTSEGSLFAAAYAGVQIGLTSSPWWRCAPSRVGVANFERILAWKVVEGGLWWPVAPTLNQTGAVTVAVVIGTCAGVCFYCAGLGRSGPAYGQISGGHQSPNDVMRSSSSTLGESILITGTDSVPTRSTRPERRPFRIAAASPHCRVVWVYFGRNATMAMSIIA